MEKKTGLTENKKDELQKTLMQLESHKRQFEAISQQSRIIDNAIAELRSTVEALKTLKENKKGVEILVPVGSDSYVRAELKDNEKVLIGVGAGISIEKNTEEAITTLESRAEDLTKTLAKLQNSAVDVNSKLMDLNDRAERLMGEMQLRR